MASEVGKAKIKLCGNLLLETETSALKIVLNVCNVSSDKFKPKQYRTAALLNNRWKKVAELDRSFSYTRNFKLGEVNTSAVQSDVWVVSMVCQEEGKTSLDHLKTCLKKVADMAKYERGYVHVSHLLFEDVPELTNDLLKEFFVDKNVNVFVYKS